MTDELHNTLQDVAKCLFHYLGFPFHSRECFTWEYGFYWIGLMNENFKQSITNKIVLREPYDSSITGNELLYSKCRLGRKYFFLSDPECFQKVKENLYEGWWK